MRELCLISSEKVLWDDYLPQDIYDRIIRFLSEMELLGDFLINRTIRLKYSDGDPVLVIYSDESKLVYGAYAYAGWPLNDGTFQSTLICAKNRQYR